jgi:hypothetical protein
MAKTFLSEDQASQYLKGRGLKVAPTTLRKKRCTGGGPEFQHFGPMPVYTPEGLDRWVDEKLTPPKRSSSDHGGIPGRRRGRPLGKKNAAKGEVAPAAE